MQSRPSLRTGASLKSDAFAWSCTKCVPFGDDVPPEAELPEECRAPLMRDEGCRPLGGRLWELGLRVGERSTAARRARAQHRIACLPGDVAVEALGPMVNPVGCGPWEGVGQRRGSSHLQRQSSGVKLTVRMISYGSLGKGWGTATDL